MEISIETPQKRFDEHLQLENNNRILFSGKFGTGKSHFLREYFKQNEDKYNLFWISPVDYVVGANQDIFEWIKIDIAKELLGKYEILEKEEKFSEGLMLSTYIYNSAGNIVANLIEKVSKLGEKYTDIDISKEVKQIKVGYAGFKKGVKDQTKPAYRKLEEYIDKYSQVKGSIYEDDFITQLIRNSIEVLAKITKKECVIVIDDLDRLDPDHIFRILNILSAHNNHFDRNKFGFARVIAVCDIENIRYLFEYRYGGKSDFEGYIEKYYTYEPFLYDFVDAISDFCQSGKIIQSLGERGKAFLAMILVRLVKNNALKIRNLRKIYNANKVYRRSLNPLHVQIDYKYVGHFFLATDTLEVYPDKYEIVDIVKILTLAVGGVDLLKVALSKISSNDVLNNENDLVTAVEIMCIPHHIAMFEHSLQNMCAEFIGDEMQYNLGWPNTRLFNSNFRLPLKWIRGYKYNGGDYFGSVEGSFYGAYKAAITYYPSWSDISNNLNVIVSYLESRSII